MSFLSDQIEGWDLGLDRPIENDSYSLIAKKIEFLESFSFHQFVPTVNPEHNEFEIRLEKWLQNVPDETRRKLMFEFVTHVQFFSREDFTKLYQVAFDEVIASWLIETRALNFDSATFQDELKTEAHARTWYCPLTDSMHISDFHHVNAIGGIDHRPDWRSLAQFGDVAKIRDYLTAKNLRQIVILEDFVGSGTQMSSAIQFIQKVSKLVPVLFIPLIVCPVGAAAGRILNNPPEVTFQPIIELSPADLITSARTRDATVLGKIAEICDATWAEVWGNGATNPRPYDPFGFPRNQGTGALVVMYSNSPANTLPIIQHTSDLWSALFPRSARIK